MCATTMNPSCAAVPSIVMAIYVQPNLAMVLLGLCAKVVYFLLEEEEWIKDIDMWNISQGENRRFQQNVNA